MLKKINCTWTSFHFWVYSLATWKAKFEEVNVELDLIQRKKETLEDLYNAGKISQFVCECLSKELAQEIENAQTRRKALAEKMTGKLNELEEQRIALEVFLANTAMAHVAGEINEELYAKENSAVELGLDATKTELNSIKDIVIEFVPKEAESTTEHPAVSPMEDTVENRTEFADEETTETTSNVPIAVPIEIPHTTSEDSVEPAQQSPTETS